MCLTSVEIMQQCYQALPKFLARTGYDNPNDSAKCAFQDGHNTHLTLSKWLQERPSVAHDLDTWMRSRTDSPAQLPDVLQFVEYMRPATSSKTPLFVDVGGGLGHRSRAFKQRYPGISGRIILQDQAAILAQATPTEGIEMMEHDIFKEQPIKGKSKDTYITPYWPYTS